MILDSGDGSELALSEGDTVAPQLPHTNHFGFRIENDQACARRASAFDMPASPRPSGSTTGGSYACKSQTPTGYRVELYAY